MCHTRQLEGLKWNKDGQVKLPDRIASKLANVNQNRGTLTLDQLDTNGTEIDKKISKCESVLAKQKEMQ